MSRPEWAVQMAMRDPVWQHAAAQREALTALLDIIEHDGKALAGLPRGIMVGSNRDEGDDLTARIRRVRDIYQRGAPSRTVYGGAHPFNLSLWERAKLLWRLARTPGYFGHTLSCLVCMIHDDFETDIRRSKGFKIELYVEPDGTCGMGMAGPETIIEHPVAA